MGVYRSIYVDAYQTATDAIRRYQETEEKLEKAKAKAKEHPIRLGWHDAKEAATAAECAAKVANLQVELESIRNTDMMNAKKALASADSEIRSRIAAEATVKPSDVDANTMTLIESGICKAADFRKLYGDAQAAGNRTMCRLIGKAADKAGRARADEYGSGDQESLGMLATAYHATHDDPDTATKSALDTISYAFDRCIENTALMQDFESLTANSVEVI